MERKLGKMVLLTLCALLMGVVSLMAQTPPQPPFSVTWQGVSSFVQEALFWQGATAYNGKIYAFGGNFDNSTEVKSIWIYDPSSDAWTKGADMPTGRYLCTAVEVGGKIYVMGGRQLTASTNPVNVNECYDPATNAWTTKAAMPKANRGHAAVAANGKIYVLGGNTGTFTNAVSIYDPSTDKWSDGPALPVKAGYGGAAYVSSTNSIYWIGGTFKSPTASTKDYVGKIYTLSLSSNTWDSGVDMKGAVTGFGVGVDDTAGKIYVLGGATWDSDNGYEDAYFANQVFDTSKKTCDYIATSLSPISRSEQNAATVNGKIYVWGSTEFNGNSTRIVDVYDPTNDTWEDPNTFFPEYYSYSPAVHAINGKIYVIGGAGQAINDKVWEIDPSQPQAAQKTGIPNDPRYAGVSGVYNDMIVLAEGANANDLTGTAEVYDPLADTFTPIANSDPTPTTSAAGTVLDGKLYVFGGYNGSSDVNTTRILDLSSGTWTTGPAMPVTMESAAAAALNGKIYIVGGYDQSTDNKCHDEIIIFDPASSTFTTGAAMPYAVMGPSVTTYQNFVVVDSGSYGFDDGGTVYFTPSGWLQFFDTVANKWYVAPRAYGKEFGGCTMIGNTFYSIAGDDILWLCNRLDIASFGGGGCTVTCTASASPSSGAPPLTVTFTATANATGCTGTPTFAWDFGDQGTSTDQNPTHTYQTEGTFNWSVTVTVDNQTCRKSGTITVGAAVCTVTCDATATPTTGAVPLTVNFTGTETHDNCTGTPTFAWDFGDQGTSTDQNATHTYQSAGTYNWSFTVTVDGKSCTKTGTVTATEVVPPHIDSVKKAADPFRLIIMGTGFKSNCKVKINNVEVPTTAFKSSTKVVAKGKGLKNMVPKGTAVTITVVNPDGGVSNEYTYTR